MSVVLVASVPAFGDRLSDLRKVLERYPAQSPITASATVRVEGGGEAGTRKGSSSFSVTSGPGGFEIRIHPETIERAQLEAIEKKRDPEKMTPTRTAMVALTIFEIMDSLDVAATLLADLNGATLLDAKPATWQGRPATLLRIKVKPTLAGTRSRLVHEPKIELRVWTLEDGVPVVAERDSSYSASFLFVKAGNTRKERWELAVRGDRLYAVRNDQSNRMSAAGKDVVSSRSVSYAIE